MAWATKPFLVASRERYPQAVAVAKACVGLSSRPSSFHFTCDMTATKTGALSHDMTFPSLINDKNFCRSASVRAIIKRHGCALPADGAQRAASNKLYNTSSETSSFVKDRDDHRSA